MKTVAIQKKSSIQNVRTLTMTAVLSAIAFVLAFFEFPVPLSPSFGTHGFVVLACADWSLCLWPGSGNTD